MTLGRKSSILLLVAWQTIFCHAIAADIPYEGTRPAPEFPGGVAWLNTDKPLTLGGLKGKVVLLDFWTYCCINCMHVIPDLKKLEAKYSKELVVIGVHSAKFENEKQSDNIRQAIQRYEIEHPVINDKDFLVWRLFGARSWPTLVLINPVGKIIGYHSGEGVFDLFDPIIGEAVRLFDAKGGIDRKPIELNLEKGRGPASLLAYPGKIAADEKSGHVVFTDSNHNRVIVASLDGEILEVVGDGEIGLKDGDFATARFFRPQGVCFDAEKNFLYIADTENHAIRKIDLTKKTVETLAGTGKQAARHNVEGKGRSLDLNSPWDLLLRGNTLYIAMAGPHQLWSLDLTTLAAKVHAGSGRENILDGPLKEANLAQPSGLATDGVRLFFADSEVSAVRTADFTPTGRVETLIGEGLFKFGDVDGKYPAARLQHCIGVGYHEGLVYVADTYNHKIKKLNPQTKELVTFIGSGKPGADDGPRTEATLNEPNGLAFARGKMLIADSNNHLIRVCDLKTGQVSTMTFTNLDRLRASGGSVFSGEEVKLKPVKFSPKAGHLNVEILLPAGTKLNPAATSTVKCLTADSRVLGVASASRELPKTKVSLPIEPGSGSTTLSIELDLYFCSKGNAGVCYFKSARLLLPVEITSDGSVKPEVQYRVER